MTKIERWCQFKIYVIAKQMCYIYKIICYIFGIFDVNMHHTHVVIDKIYKNKERSLLYNLMNTIFKKYFSDVMAIWLYYQSHRFNGYTICSNIYV